MESGDPSEFAAQDPRLADAIGDDIALSSFSIWTHFGGNPVSPKWIMQHERDIWVVKCPFSSKTDRLRRSEAAHLTIQMSQKQFRLRFRGPEGSPNRFKAF